MRAITTITRIKITWAASMPSSSLEVEFKRDLKLLMIFFNIIFPQLFLSQDPHLSLCPYYRPTKSFSEFLGKRFPEKIVEGHKPLFPVCAPQLLNSTI